MDAIHFGNQKVLETPLLLKYKAGSLPAMVILAEKFRATVRYLQYLNTEQL